MPVGHAKYKKSYPEELVEYFSVDPMTEDTYFPSLAGFARKIKVTRCVMYQWQEKYPEWKKAVEISQAMQEDWLLQKGLKSKINTAFGIFVLKNLSGYKDRHETEVVQQQPFQFAYDLSKGEE